MIYFDNAATTAPSPAVIETMAEVMRTTYGNPSSVHSFGRQASKILRDSRQMVADCLHVPSRQIIFTAGGTESNNTAIKGYVLANQDKGKHIITTAIEHHSVLHTMAYLEERFGYHVTYLKPQNQKITVEQVADALRSDTVLVSMMFANNETGNLFPIQEVGQLLANHQAVFHVDAVQAIGKLPIYPAEWQIDFLSASAHKFNGPKGVGFLYANALHFDPLLHGGDQEEKRRSGTENLAAIAGLSRALADHLTNQAQNWQKIRHLKEVFLKQIASLNYYLNSDDTAIPYVINIGFSGQNNAILITQLDLAGFAVSTGSACTAGNVEPSHVLMATYGDNAPQLSESIRISFSDLNTEQEVLALAQKLIEIVGN